ncbi:cytochrome b/b6 domain-containing protein [Armatimonas sp.]|uniref:cytochrome b/b6 domain-containing protein n=1 Tax=Armatimonas sp. TaxID=1872638 RepID=UPI00286D3C56|nr:cytochrome b/b6 domain-containing protein [Armatimonas sp.]
MARIVKKHPLAIRWFHWINFPVLALMIWSGTLILWANDTYATQLYQSGYRVLHGGAEDKKPPKWLKVPDRIILRPDVRVLYSGDTLPDTYPAEEKRTEIILWKRLAEGMAWHFLLAWLFAINGAVYVIFLISSGQWRYLVPQKNSLIEAGKVAIKDLAFWKKIEAAPEGEKYNHAQRIAYSGVVVLGVLMLITGIAISKPAQLGWLAVPFGGYQGARLIHFIVTCLFVAFFFVHVSQVARAGWNNFRAMITGWEMLLPKHEPMVGLIEPTTELAIAQLEPLMESEVPESAADEVIEVLEAEIVPEQEQP